MLIFTGESNREKSLKVKLDGDQLNTCVALAYFVRKILTKSKYKRDIIPVNVILTLSVIMSHVVISNIILKFLEEI